MTTISAHDLLRAHSWSRAFFTTYSLSLSFFESVILDSIVRNNTRSVTILADVAGVRGAMEEYGAQAAGRMYDVEPVAVLHGCFHPKLLVLTLETEAHVLVGSGNLTFGGWGTNLECLEHLHVSFASRAINDLAGFLEKLSDTPRARHAARQECKDVAADLRQRIAGRKLDGSLRILHNLNTSILEQIVGVVQELGGALSLTLASPFFDGIAVPQLCERLGLESAFIHVHDGGSVAGSAGSNWPTGAAGVVVPIALDMLNEVTKRPLHAKLFEIRCQQGRLLISGSANATHAGLGFGGNVELCVLRVEQASLSGWAYSASQVPALTPVQEFEDLELSSMAVLRATLVVDRLDGTVFGAFPSGRAKALRRDGVDWLEVGTTTISPGGHFLLQATSLRYSSWSGQVILRLVSELGQLAQGFVSLPESRDIARRLGSAASSFFGLLQGTGTPADIAAIMEFFYKNPDALPTGTVGSGGGDHSHTQNGDASINIAQLLGGMGAAQSSVPAVNNQHHSWIAFMQMILSRFAEIRSPLEEDLPEEGEEQGSDGRQTQTEKLRREKSRHLATLTFEKLLSRMLKESAAKRATSSVFQLTQFVCIQLKPEPGCIKAYLKRLVDSFLECGVKPAESGLFTAATVLLGTQADDGLKHSPTVRRYLLRGLAVLPESLPDLASVEGLQRLLPSGVDPTLLWESVCATRTPQEEAKILNALTTAPFNEDFPFLKETPEWKILLQGKGNFVKFLPRMQDYCPACSLRLSSVDASRLRATAVTTHGCGRILLCGEA